MGGNRTERFIATHAAAARAIARKPSPKPRTLLANLRSRPRRNLPEGERLIPTDISLTYREERWGLARLILDGLTNHLKDDSGGARTRVKLRQNGRWVDLLNADPRAKTEAVLFADNGPGYSEKFLSTLFSSKKSKGKNAGMFGEGGTKMGPAAALRHGIEMELRSRTWIATPYVETVTVRGQPVERLCFRVTPNRNGIRGSRTIFYDPPPELLAEVFAIPKKVLAFQPDLKVHHAGLMFGSDYRPRIVSVPEQEPTLYVKGVAIKALTALFSYDLAIDVPPDRAQADYTDMMNGIRGLIEHCSNTEVLHRILRAAHEKPDTPYVEVSALDPNSRSFGQIGLKPQGGRKNKLSRHLLNRTYIREENNQEFEVEGIANLLEGNLANYFSANRFQFAKGRNLFTPSPWVTAFHEVFGEEGKELVLASEFNQGANTDAIACGYKPVRLPSGLARFLNQAGVRYAHELNLRDAQEHRWVNVEELTEAERATLARTQTINRRIFGTTESLELRVFSGVYSANGREIEAELGVQVTEPDGHRFLGVKRTLLNEPVQFDDVYVHEAGHYFSGKPDHHPEFTGFFATTLARCLQGHLPLPEAVARERRALLLNCLAKGTATGTAETEKILPGSRIKLSQLLTANGHLQYFADDAMDWSLYFDQKEPTPTKPRGLVERAHMKANSIQRNRRTYAPVEDLQTMVSLDYRQAKWGVRRMVLDAISNHFPEDSGGKSLGVFAVQGGKVVEIQQVDRSKPIDQIIFADDGRGYETANLHLLYSDKDWNGDSTGQFGEGLKLAAAAALRAGIHMEYRSQDWRATPMALADEIDDMKFDRVSYRMERCAQPIVGSQTIFHNPAPELLEAVFNLPHEILDYAGQYVEHYRGKSVYFSKTEPLSRIVSRRGGKRNALFVRGVRITDLENALFSYDLGTRAISPDRDQADHEILEGKLTTLLTECTDETVLHTILKKAEQWNALDVPYEFTLLEPEPVTEKQYFKPFHWKKPGWIKAFQSLYGDKAVLAGHFVNGEDDREATALGYTPVRLHPSIRSFLEECGVPTSRAVAHDKHNFAWVNEPELAAEESAGLALIRQINQVLFGIPEAFPIRVFSSVTSPSGKPLESSGIKRLPGGEQTTIALTRSLLGGDPAVLAEKYILEVAAAFTGEVVTHRETVNFLTGALARLHDLSLTAVP